MGGIQKSLVNLVKEVNMDYDITLLLFSKNGLLLHEIPENVKIITPYKGYEILGVEKKDLKKHPLLFFAESIYADICKNILKKKRHEAAGAVSKRDKRI